MRFAIVAGTLTQTNAALVASGLGRWAFLEPEAALESLSAGDVVLGRFDVDPVADGVQDGLWVLGALAARGVTVLNDAAALLTVHDKLLTARLLRRLAIPHPRTAHVRPGRPVPCLTTPVVVKPRFGSSGAGVVLCRDEDSLVETLSLLEMKPWYREHGVLAQELVPPRGFDLRILVCDGRVVGSVFRIARRGEWRTNVALGGVRKPIDDPPESAGRIALEAAAAVGTALVGVDLVLDETGEWTVLELNGAVEFNVEYRLDGDVHADVLRALESASTRVRRRFAESL